MTVSEGPSLVYYLSPKGLHNAVSEDLNYTTQKKAMLFLLGTVPEEETVHQDRVMLEQAHQGDCGLKTQVDIIPETFSTNL